MTKEEMDLEWLLYDLVLKHGMGLKLREWQAAHGIFDEEIVAT